MKTKGLDYSNTEVAFRHKSDLDLWVQYWLFRTMSSGVVVAGGRVASRLADRLGVPVGWALRPTLYRHFVTGASLEESLPAIQQLADMEVYSVMDYSAEGGGSDAEARDNYLENLRAIRFAAKHRALSHAVLKVSGIGDVALLERACDPLVILSAGEEIELARVEGRIMQLCATAEELGVRLLVDAEHYAYQEWIDRITEKAMVQYNQKRATVFATLQMYRHDRLAYLNRLDRMAKQQQIHVGVKLVRGAYMEEERERALRMGYPDPIYPTKEDTDRAYNAAIAYVVPRLKRMELFVGTHNDKSLRLLVELMKDEGIRPDDPRVYSAQLYGMSDHLTMNLAEAGYRVAKYCPYAPVEKVLPYLLRRAQENTSVRGQTPRELAMLRCEMERRRSNP